ncbi:MAG: flagellar protein FlbD [Planctomycetes bacterium]|nr:flagellar protein FlbD [Planctomycetota bacterium]
MIALTRMDGTRISLNVDRIESVERVPETMLRLIDGRSLMVRETLDEVVSAFKQWQREIANHAFAGTP